VIADNHNMIISTGYTGAPVGQLHCVQCWRVEHKIPSGVCYEKCRSVHAEMNALLQAGKAARNAVLYLAGVDSITGALVAHRPCFLCSKMIINARISTVIVRQTDGSYISYQPKEIYDTMEKEIFLSDYSIL
jgi:dCMP deaminase